MLRINKYMSELGKKGGSAGTGKSKVRGNSDYYKKLAKIATENRRKNKPYICPDKNCPDTKCKHSSVHFYDPENCSGEGTQCPACVPYKEGKK